MAWNAYHLILLIIQTAQNLKDVRNYMCTMSDFNVQGNIFPNKIRKKQAMLVKKQDICVNNSTYFSILWIDSTVWFYCKCKL